MSEKNDGNMKINHDGEKSTNPNRRRFFKKKGIPEENVISALLHHGHEVSIVGHNSSREFIPKTDALVTVIKGTYLSITNADCFPIFFFDPIGEVVGLAHAGWKGITTNIIPITIGKMTVAGSDIENLRVIIGPGICHDCFEFGLKAIPVVAFRRQIDLGEIGLLGSIHDLKRPAVCAAGNLLKRLNAGAHLGFKSLTDAFSFSHQAPSIK